MFVNEGGSGALNWGVRWTRLNSGSIQAGGARRGTHGVDRCGTSRKSRDAARRTDSGVRAACSFQSGEGE